MVAVVDGDDDDSGYDFLLLCYVMAMVASTKVTPVTVLWI